MESRIINQVLSSFSNNNFLKTFRKFSHFCLQKSGGGGQFPRPLAPWPRYNLFNVEALLPMMAVLLFWHHLVSTKFNFVKLTSKLRIKFMQP